MLSRSLERKPVVWNNNVITAYNSVNLHIFYNIFPGENLFHLWISTFLPHDTKNVKVGTIDIQRESEGAKQISGNSNFAEFMAWRLLVILMITSSLKCEHIVRFKFSIFKKELTTQ